MKAMEQGLVHMGQEHTGKCTWGKSTGASVPRQGHDDKDMEMREQGQGHGYIGKRTMEQGHKCRVKVVWEKAPG